MVSVSNPLPYDAPRLQQNAFIERLSPMGFSIFPSLVVDILHEFDLGISKSVLKHLFRIVYVVDPSHIHVVNNRYVLLDAREYTNGVASWWQVQKCSVFRTKMYSPVPGQCYRHRPPTGMVF